MAVDVFLLRQAARSFSDVLGLSKQGQDPGSAGCDCYQGEDPRRGADNWMVCRDHRGRENQRGSHRSYGGQKGSRRSAVQPVTGPDSPDAETPICPWMERSLPLSTYVLALRPTKVVREKFNVPIVRELAAFGLFIRQRIARVFMGTSNLGEWSVHKITRFSSEHDRLWRLSAKEYGCAVVRDSSYLNWKYVDQPGMQFIRLELTHRNKLRAIATLMLTEPGEVYRYRRGFIVDLVVPSSDTEAVSMLLASCVSELEARAADLVVFYLGNHVLERIVQRFGFIRREPRHVLLVAVGGMSIETVIVSFQATSGSLLWAIPMSTSGSKNHCSMCPDWL